MALSKGQVLDCIVMKSDLSTLSPINILSKYADDINLIVPQNCDVDVATEFDSILQWAMHNKMTVNLSKTNENVFRRPCPLRYNLVLCVDGVALVDHVKSGPYPGFFNRGVDCRGGVPPFSPLPFYPSSPSPSLPPPLPFPLPPSLPSLRSRPP